MSGIFSRGAKLLALLKGKRDEQVPVHAEGPPESPFPIGATNVSPPIWFQDAVSHSQKSRLKRRLSFSSNESASFVEPTSLETTLLETPSECSSSRRRNNIKAVETNVYAHKRVSALNDGNNNCSPKISTCLELPESASVVEPTSFETTSESLSPDERCLLETPSECSSSRRRKDNNKAIETNVYAHKRVSALNDGNNNYSPKISKCLESPESASVVEPTSFETTSESLSPDERCLLETPSECSSSRRRKDNNKAIETNVYAHKRVSALNDGNNNCSPKISTCQELPDDVCRCIPVDNAVALTPVVSGGNTVLESSDFLLDHIFEGNVNEVTFEVIPCDEPNPINSESQDTAATSNARVDTSPIVTPELHEVQEENDILPNNTIQATNNNINQETNQTAQKKSSRKRSRNPSQSKCAKAKEALYKGEAHHNKQGKFRPAPVMRLPCACRSKCSLKISESQRAKIFDCYNKKLGSKDRQWAFIRAHSTCGPVAKRTTDNETPKRKVSRKYFFRVTSEDGTKITINVCKVMFMNTLDIWDGVVDSAYNHINKETNTPTPDKRGRHENRPKKATEAMKESARTHIESYPRVPSHYVRAKSKREYLEHGLSCAKMHRQYQEWCETNNTPLCARASKSEYTRIVNYEYNIGFFKPKKDRCQLCMKIKTCTRREREKFKYQYAAHIHNKQGAYAQLKQVRTLLTKREDVAMLSFDLQKVLPCPKSETSVFFYKNKLSIYNLTVYNSRTHQGECYLWHAGEGKRGANEVGTAVMCSLTDVASGGAKEAFSFSDSSAGQNKNRFIYAMLLLVSVKSNLKIRHCFLEPGHTYNDADSVHARIERSSEGKEIYDFDEWIETIENAKVQEPKYKVRVLKRFDFLNLKDIVSKQNWDKDTKGNKITWSKVKVVEAGYAEDGLLGLQYSYGGEKIFLDCNQKRGHPVNLKTYKPPRAFNDRIPLKAKTVKHLQELCKSLAIPSKYHEFYSNIFNNVDPIEEEDDADDPQVEADSVDPECLFDDMGGLERDENEEEDSEAEDEEGNAQNNDENDKESLWFSNIVTKCRKRTYAKLIIPRLFKKVT